ncbi:MAG: helix-turn-helix transcriptional regulator [Clostridia bacterium]|nr:helix-turn-helix transcriptional regulator [Clostridia bacterium]
MKIGEKIKKLRTDKLMSQTELAGGEITRNMLSQIEHGSATPSLNTVNYIAARLNVSPGFLLADEDDEQLYLKHAEISNVKKAYTAGNFALCYDMCKNCQWRDDELTLILAKCALRVGVEEFSKGELHIALEMLDEALELCGKTIYDTDMISSEARAYFEYMELISPTLASNGEDPARIILLYDEFSVYSGIICESEGYGWSEVSHLEERRERLSADGSYALHVEARLLMENGEYGKAIELLHRLLYSESYELPEPMLYFVFCDLEICCKETDDFKGAYEHSTNKMALLQKMLA